jgi:hypothetical protein
MKPTIVLAALFLALSLIACSSNSRLPSPVSTITCADANGIGPDREFTFSDSNVKGICLNNICYLTSDSPVCFYDCGPDQQAAGMFSPCWPAPTPTPTPSPTP